MPQPAIRLGDPGTHAGVTTSGMPTVLIGGQPAARVGDTHTEPVPPFHGVQTIAQGAATVLIGGQPAARAGDLVSCGAALIATQFTVVVGA